MKNSNPNHILRNSGVALLAVPPGGKVIPLAVILAGFVAMLALNLPGHLSYDSVIQLLDGRSGQYHTWHPPVMAFLLGLGDAVLRGSGLFMGLNAALCFLPLASLLWLKDKVTWLTVLAALGMALTPQLLLYQGILWKDVLFANAALAGFVCLAHVGSHWANPRTRFGLIAAAVAFFLLAALARQNGVIVIGIGALALGWIASRCSGARNTGITYGLTALVALALLMTAGTMALNLRSANDNGPAAQINQLRVYDLIGALVQDPGMPLPILQAQAPKLAARMRDDGVRLYSPLKIDTLEASQNLQDGIATPASAKPIAQEWRNLILHRPFLYLRVRAAVFAQVFLTPDLRQCVPYYVGVDGPADAMAELHLTRRWNASDRFLANYASRFVGTPIFSHVAFAALALVLLITLLRRKRPADIALAAMLVAALIFSLSFFAISIACDYRYLYALDLSALYALLYLV